LVEKPTVDFSFSAGQDANVIFKNLTSDNATSYRWEFGDGLFSVEKNITHDFLKDGEYKVTLTATNACGDAKIVKTIKVETLPRAAFSINANKGCVPFTLQITNQASASATQYAWRFPGAEKDTSSQKNPVVKYTKSGTYDIFLTVKNGKGKDSIVKKNILVLEDKPVANFEVKTNLLKADFMNKSTNYTAIKWEFGDVKNTSIEEKPTFLFAKNGIYKVTLTATNQCGISKLTKDVEVIDKVECDSIVCTISPNPATEIATITFNAGRYTKMPYIFCTVDGKVISRGDFDENQNSFEFDLTRLAGGIYILYMKCDKRVITKKILKLDY
jgi:PKD repeat protein